MRRFLVDYAARHRHPANIALHAIGLPITFLLPLWLLAIGEGFFALLAFLAGYGLQFLGHAIEGNDAGEVVLLKRLLGREAVPIAPRYLQNDAVTGDTAAQENAPPEAGGA